MRPDETTVLLIRHGHTNAIGRRLVGRTPGVHLTPQGRAQAVRLVDTLAGCPIAHLYSSPLERALETAEPIARVRSLEVLRDDALVEVDFGAWTGLTFDALARLPEWQHFTHHRSIAEVPGGESAPAVQARIVATLERLRVRHPGQTIAVVSHADVIRAAALHYAGASLDMVQRIEISPASVTGLAFGDDGPRVLFVNHRDIGPRGAARVPPAN